MEKVEHIQDSNSQVYEVENVIDKRQKGRRVEYLVKWKGYSLEECTWEPLKNLQNCPELIQAFLTKQKDSLNAKAPQKPKDKPQKKGRKSVTEKPVVVEHVKEVKAVEVDNGQKSKLNHKLTKIRDAKSKSKDAQEKVEYQMEIEDTVAEDKQLEQPVPIFNKKVLLDEKKYSTTKEIKNKEDCKKLLNAIGKASHIDRHLIIDNTLYFICSWTDKLANANYSKFCITFDEMEAHNSRLLLSYLKTCLVKEIS